MSDGYITNVKVVPGEALTVSSIGAPARMMKVSNDRIMLEVEITNLTADLTKAIQSGKMRIRVEPYEEVSRPTNHDDSSKATLETLATHGAPPPPKKSGDVPVTNLNHW